MSKAETVSRQTGKGKGIKKPKAKGIHWNYVFIFWKRKREKPSNFEPKFFKRYTTFVCPHFKYNGLVKAKPKKQDDKVLRLTKGERRKTYPFVLHIPFPYKNEKNI